MLTALRSVFGSLNGIVPFKIDTSGFCCIDCSTCADNLKCTDSHKGLYTRQKTDGQNAESRQAPEIEGSNLRLCKDCKSFTIYQSGERCRKFGGIVRSPVTGAEEWRGCYASTLRMSYGDCKPEGVSWEPKQ